MFWKVATLQGVHASFYSSLSFMSKSQYNKTPLLRITTAYVQQLLFGETLQDIGYRNILNVSTQESFLEYLTLACHSCMTIQLFKLSWIWSLMVLLSFELFYLFFSKLISKFHRFLKIELIRLWRLLERWHFPQNIPFLPFSSFQLQIQENKLCWMKCAY